LFCGALRISHRAWRLPVQPVIGNSGKGSGEEILRKEGVHFLGCDRCMEKEGL